MKKNIFTAFISWLPLSIAIIGICGMIYYSIQQCIRESANDIPMQYAMDTKEKLENGVSPIQSIDGIAKTDLQKSVAPFIIIYNNNGAAQASTTLFRGYYPSPSAGVFEIAKQKGENRITWQVQTGLRNAVVILPYTINGMEGFVLAGKPLREIERLDRGIFLLTLCGMVLTLLVTFLVTLTIRSLINWVKPKKN